MVYGQIIEETTPFSGHKSMDTLSWIQEHPTLKPQNAINHGNAETGMWTGHLRCLSG